MVAKDPNTRKLVAKIASHSRWAQTEDRSGATAVARKAAQDRFLKQVDPEGKLDPETRALMAEHARKAFYTRMALISAEARRKRAEARRKYLGDEAGE